MILKICADYQKVTWLECSRLTSIGFFDTLLKEKIKDAQTDRDIRDYVIESAHAELGSFGGPTIDMAPFHEGVESGCVLKVFFQDKDGPPRSDDFGIWIVPLNSCFLLSDSGKTVDRI